MHEVWDACRGMISVGQRDWLGTWRIHPRYSGACGDRLTNAWNEWGRGGDPKHMDLIGMILPNRVEFELDNFGGFWEKKRPLSWAKGTGADSSNDLFWGWWGGHWSPIISRLWKNRMKWRNGTPLMFWFFEWIQVQCRFSCGFSDFKVSVPWGWFISPDWNSLNGSQFHEIHYCFFLHNPFRDETIKWSESSGTNQPSKQVNCFQRMPP